MKKMRFSSIIESESNELDAGSEPAAVVYYPTGEAKTFSRYEWNLFEKGIRKLEERNLCEIEIQ